MKKENYKPQGIPDLFPYLVARDMKATIDFYKEAFGFELVAAKKEEDREDGEIVHAEMKHLSSVIMFCPEESYGSNNKTPATLGVTSPLMLYIYCYDVDALYNQAISNGAKSLEAPNDAFWGDRFCKIVDLNGYEWMFATAL